MKMNKHFYAGTLIIVFIMMLVTGCVKLPSEAPPLPEFKAQIRFVNAASDVQGTASVFVDGQNKASLALGAASGYMEFDAGSRVFKLQDQPAETLFVDSDFFGTVFIQPLANADKRFAKNRERWIYNNTQPDDSTAGLTIVQLLDDAQDVTVSFENDDAWDEFSGATGSIWKTELPMGDYLMTVVAGEDTVKMATETIGNKAELTYVLLGTAANLTITKLNNE